MSEIIGGFIEQIVTGQFREDEKLSGLVDGFLENDKEKTGKLIETFYRKIYSNCLRILCDPYAAEDQTNETFIRAIKYRRTYDKKYKFSNWLLKISTNLCLNALRSRNTENKFCMRLDSLEVTFGNLYELKLNLVDQKSIIVFDEKFENEFVRKTIEAMPAIYRIPILLKYYCELSYEEIAYVIEKPVGTVKFRISRAKALLAKLLSDLM
jgi:RNA polymerase sigma-70 factor (ECF subfamily)